MSFTTRVTDESQGSHEQNANLILSIITGAEDTQQTTKNTAVNKNNESVKKKKMKKVEKKEIAQKNKNKIPKRYRTLFGLVHGMIGCPVAVEFKDDSIAEGILYEVLYPSCDMTLTNVKYKRYLQINKTNIETMYIKGPRVRYIIFPDYLNIKKILRKAEQRKLRAKNFYGRTTRK